MNLTIDQIDELTIDQKAELMASCGEEVVTLSELKGMISTKNAVGQEIRVYDGFEVNLQIHIAQGLKKMIYVNKMVDAGCTVIFWVADYFSMLNGKMGGDLERMKIAGQYFIEVWKACGMKLDSGRVKFLWASEGKKLCF